MKIEIVKYNPINKQSLLGAFNCAIDGIEIRDCKHFSSPSGDWVSWPSKEYTKDDKKKFWPLIAVGDRERDESVRKELLAVVNVHLEGTPF